MTDKDEEVHVDTDRARAGATPHMTRYILAISMVIIVIIFAVIVWSGT
ncbi:hypothetical protein [Stakelama pacifica]|uniref:Uncharacterized protein n=1 Tax=Stakelama pacifica TaxID=517720 RepID=A0A4R6FTR4_9SPHN|nr:hypothetical protein [Stakelama pacifica]TDN84590.1 hypothetical protein EV664_103236 [Stakelama pacifica]GGO93362.1 hypothetical protein GCM10011329_12610 [Stakelama pacifica]